MMSVAWGRAEIEALIDWDLWEKQVALEAREKQSLELALRYWALMEAARP
jgi:hypothetical protein